jgi:type IV secretory pathway VirB3-like protein
MISGKKEARDLFLLMMLFLLASTIVFSQLGIKNVSDSSRYLNYASNLEDGFYIDKHNFWYIGYVIFIFIVRFLTDSYSELNLILAQYLYSLFGLILLYKTIKIFEGDTSAPLIGGILYLLFIEVCIWNVYILCESFYFNNILIAFYFLAKIFVQKKHSAKNLLFAVFFLALTAMSKPTGVVIILSVTGTAYMYFWRRSSTPQWFKVVILVVVFLLIGFLLNLMLETFLIIENYQYGEIVYGISTLPQKEYYNSLTVTVPELNTLSDQYPPIVRLLHFIFFNFYFWCLLFLNKVYYFLLHIRPYWSLKHNLYNLFILTPVFILAIRQIIKTRFFVRFFACTYLGFHILIVGITTVDWDGRFFLPLVPIILLFAAQGINRLIIWLTRNISGSKVEKNRL